MSSTKAESPATSKLKRLSKTTPPISSSKAESDGMTGSNNPLENRLAARMKEIVQEEVESNGKRETSSSRRRRPSIQDITGNFTAERLTSSFRRERHMERANKISASVKGTWAVLEADREVRTMMRDMRKTLAGYVERNEREERLKLTYAAEPADEDDKGSLYIRLVRAAGLRAADRNGLSDPYVKLTLNDRTHRSKTIRKTLDPIYDQTFRWDGTLRILTTQPLNLIVMDYDVASFDDVLGIAQLDLAGQYYHGIAKDHSVKLEEGFVEVQVTWRNASGGRGDDDEGGTTFSERSVIGGLIGDGGGGGLFGLLCCCCFRAKQHAVGASTGFCGHFSRLVGPTLHPDSRFRTLWNVCLACMIVYCGIAVPLEIAFETDMDQAMCGVGQDKLLRGDCRDFLLWFWLNAIVDVFFMIDIFINFRTGFVREGHFVGDGWLVAKNYMRGSFLLDCAGTFPINLVMLLVTPDNPYGDPALAAQNSAGGGGGDAGRINRLLRLVRIAKLLKLARMAKLAKYMEDFEEFLNAGVLAILKLTLISIFCCHWIGCLWWLVSGMEMDDYATPYYVGENLWHPPFWLKHETSLTTKYLHSFFWGAGMVTSLVPRDIEPATAVEAVVTITAMFFGLMLNALIISSLTQALASMDSKKELFGKQLDQMKSFLMLKGAPRDMRGRVLEYYEYLFSSSVALNDITREQFEHMPPALSAQVNLSTTRGLVTRCMLFHYVSDSTLVTLVSTLDPLVCVPSQWLAVKGQGLDNLYFIVRGRVHQSARGHEPARLLTNNDNFGADDFIQACVDEQPPHVTASARSITFCDVLALPTITLEQVVAEDPDFDANIEKRKQLLAEAKSKEASERLKEMSKRSTSKRTIFGNRRGSLSPTPEKAIRSLGRFIKKSSNANGSSPGPEGSPGSESSVGSRPSSPPPPADAKRGQSFRNAILRASERLSGLAPSFAPAGRSPSSRRASPNSGERSVLGTAEALQA